MVLVIASVLQTDVHSVDKNAWVHCAQGGVQFHQGGVEMCLPDLLQCSPFDSPQISGLGQFPISMQVAVLHTVYTQAV